MGPDVGLSDREVVVAWDLWSRRSESLQQINQICAVSGEAATIQSLTDALAL